MSTLMTFRPAAHAAKRSLVHTPQRRHASVLFALSALSNSRETQHFNKLTRLPRFEHSPPLKLIKTGEIDPFPLPTPPNPPVAAWSTRSGRSVAHIWDDRALRIGRVVLSDQARQMHRLRRMVARSRRREARKDAIIAKDRRSWQEERRKFHNDMRAAGMWILLSIGTATALATWRFWPTKSVQNDPGAMGRKLAAKASAAMPLPAVTAKEPIVNQITTVMSEQMVATAQPVVKAPPAVSHTTSSSWWKNLFWKQ